MFQRNATIFFSACFLLAACIPTAPKQHWLVAANGAYSASLEKNGEALVIGSLLHGGSYWNTQKYAREYNWNHKENYLTEILYSDISDNGQFALTANYYNLVLWDTHTGEAVWFWEAPARIESADLSAEGRFAVLGLDNNKAVLFDIQNGGVLRDFEHQGPVISVSINVEKGIVLTGSEDSTAKLWNLRDASLIRSFEFKNQVSLVKLSDSGQLALMSPANEKAQLWNIGTRKKIADLLTAKIRLYSARFVGDQKILVGSTHRNLYEFDTVDGKKTNSWRVGKEKKQGYRSTTVLDIAWRNSELIAIGSNGYLYTF